MKQPPNGIATNLEEAMLVSDKVGFPLVVRPSYVLGGRAMDVVYKKSDLEIHLVESVQEEYEKKAIYKSIEAIEELSEVNCEVTL